jgi:hypothetical protein
MHDASEECACSTAGATALVSVGADHTAVFGLCPAAGTTRLLYRMSMDFLGWARFVPGIQKVWKGVAGQVGTHPAMMLFDFCKAGC